MNTQTTQASTATTSLTRYVATAAVAGGLASVAMIAYAMLAALTYQGSGFFTPLHHIASLFLSPQSMMTSMEGAMGGSPFGVVAGAALLGAVIHLVTGLAYGAVFGLVAGLARLRGGLVVVAATVWGLVIFAFSAFIGLPAAAAIFDSGDQIAEMARMVGYDTFLIEHLIYGLVLGLLLAMRSRVARVH